MSEKEEKNREDSQINQGSHSIIKSMKFQDKLEIPSNNNINESQKTHESKGKFMEINPHFSVLQKNINLLKEGIYDNSKKTLILKGSIQNSQNYIRKNSNKVYKNIVDQFYEVRKLFKIQVEKAKNANLSNLKMFSGVIDFNQKLKKELNQCEYLLNHCENEVGYKLTKDPCYSFLKKENNKTTFKNVG